MALYVRRKLEGKPLEGEVQERIRVHRLSSNQSGPRYLERSVPSVRLIMSRARYWVAATPRVVIMLN